MNNHLHAFRAFAIFNVVACHALSEQVWLAGGPETSGASNVLNAFTESLFHGSTLYFALISGVLFSLFLSNKGWSRFFTNKCKHVVAPYLLVSLLFSVLIWQQSSFWPSLYSGDNSDFVINFSQSLIYGSAMFHLWYLPVLFILFLFTPLLALLLESKKGTMVIFIIAILPLLFSRTWPALSISSIIYFLGAYAFGMLIGLHYRRALEIIEKYERLFKYVAVISSLLLMYLYYTGFNTTSISLIESLSYLQKMAISAFILNYFVTCGRQIPKPILILGTYAFTIYFFHFVILMMAQNLQLAYFGMPVSLIDMSVWGLVFMVFALVIPLILGIIIKTLLGKHSRYFIGA